MTPEELYEMYRECGEKYWNELDVKEQDRWNRVARAVDSWGDAQYLEGWNAGEFGD
ncbi:hypothetical protein FHT44_004942 [Mycolicibacterium sp. BK634]|uniref:hypothetical protein n=1 Tax=Mycolicibacterium sp. BK634 TaxID=2587099 RepID=UPI00161CBCC6|nr:hypothetical protein [Mycolicibacterium sp. BK634]MBB3752430.1 hypothetical protein [Mycolicibacterium sp. BK634]